MFKSSTNQSLKQTQVKGNNQGKDGMPPINLSRQGSNKSAASSQSGNGKKPPQDQNRIQSNQGSSRSISKQSSLASEEGNARQQDDKLRNLIIENNHIVILLEEKTQELEDLKNSYKNQYKEIMEKVDQMEMFIQQQDKQNHDMMIEQQQKDEIIEQLEAKVIELDHLLEQERIKCLGYQANFTQIESHIGQVITENESLNILKDQREAELKKKELQLNSAIQKIEEFETKSQAESQSQQHQESYLQQNQNNIQYEQQIYDYQLQDQDQKDEIANLKHQIEELISKQSDYEITIFKLNEQLEGTSKLNDVALPVSKVARQIESQSTYEQTPMNIEDEQSNSHLNEVIKQKEEMIQSLMEKLTISPTSSNLFQSTNLFETQITKFKEELYSNQLLVEQLNEENTQLKLQIQQLQQDFVSKQESSHLSKSEQDEVWTLKAQVNELQEEINKLENQILEQCENQTKLLNEKIRAEQTANLLNQQTDSLKNELQNLNSIIKNKKSSGEKTSLKLEEFRQQIKQLTLENSEVTSKNTQLSSELLNLKSQLSIVNISLEASQQLATIRGEELAQYQDKLKSNMEQIDQYKKQYSSALENLLKYQNNIQCN